MIVMVVIGMTRMMIITEMIKVILRASTKNMIVVHLCLSDFKTVARHKLLFDLQAIVLS